MLQLMKYMKKKQTSQKIKPDVQFILANDRTLLAWIRTGLTLIAGGVAVAFLAGNVKYGALAGFGAIVAGGLIAAVGYWRYQSADKAVRSGKLPPVGRGGLWVVIGVGVFAAALIAIKSL